MIYSRKSEPTSDFLMRVGKRETATQRVVCVGCGSPTVFESRDGCVTESCVHCHTAALIVRRPPTALELAAREGEGAKLGRPRPSPFKALSARGAEGPSR